MVRPVHIIALLALFASSARAAEGEPDRAKLVKAGEAAAARFEKDPVTYTAKLQAGPIGFEVEVIRHADRCRQDFSVHVQGKRFAAATLIERDGFWYVRDENTFRRWRPHEAIFGNEVLYTALHHAQLSFISGVDFDFGQFTKTDSGRAIYRKALSDAQRQHLITALKNYDLLEEKSPGISKKPENAAAIELMDRMLKDGMTLEVDVDHGFLAAFGDVTKRTTLTPLRWLKEVPAGTFDVDDRKWDDRATDPLRGDLNDLIMFAHDPSWKPGRRDAQALVLLDIRTGETRRVPCPLPMSGDGAFTRDRKHVIVSALDSFGSGFLTLYEVALKDGAARPLGGELLQDGHSLMASVSPDGKTLAAIHTSPGLPMLRSQVVLIDLATGEAQKLGKPMDTAFLSWLPDQSGLILIHRVLREGQRFTDNSVARMDLKGDVTILRRGGSPKVLAKFNAILFQEDDQADRLWKLCDLDGKNERLLGDGMKGCGFPSLGPDGLRLMMSRFDPKNGPHPEIVDIATGKTTPVRVGAGFWGVPSW